MVDLEIFFELYLLFFDVAIVYYLFLLCSLAYFKLLRTMIYLVLKNCSNAG